MGPAKFRLTSVVTPLSIQGEGEKSQNLAPKRFTENKAMTKFKMLGAAAMLSLMFATPVFAQAAIQEPGLFAFYYPNNDVLNGGRPTPAAGLDARTLMQFNSSDAYGTSVTDGTKHFKGNEKCVADGKGRIGNDAAFSMNHHRQNGDDEDVRKLNPIFNRPFRRGVHVVCGGIAGLHQQEKRNDAGG